MKKFLSVLLCVAIIGSLLAFLFGCSGTPREETLWLYMPGEYIDEDIFEEFAAWYKEETGDNVTVKLKVFDAVEDIQLAVETNKSDYDLLCPSDYMVQYLIGKGLVQKVDKTIVDVEKEGLFRQEFLTMARNYYDPTLEYAVPYMYGTLGLVYDYSKTKVVDGNHEHINSWTSYFGDDYAGHRSLKQSMRDAYAAACIYNARAELLAGTKTIQSIFEDTTEATVNAAKTALQAVKTGGAEWDVDNVKFEMAANDSEVAVALMWSCDAGYVMNTYEDEDGNEHEGNHNLWYVVPEEGGNVYIDNFVINKYAVNVKAANYFLKYLCRTDVAVKNSEYSGCISTVAEAYREMYDYYDEDEDELFSDEDVASGWKDMYMETMFPSAEVLSRCGVMRAFATQNDANRVKLMWSTIR